MDYTWFSNAPMLVGRGSLEYLSTLESSRVALVSDSFAMARYGHIQQVEGLLRQTGAEIELVADIQQEPKISDLQEPIEHIRCFGPSIILALGGGAVIDAAKGLWFFYENPNADWEQAFRPFALPPLGRKARLIAVPTTSGTGSETTCVAVFVNQQGRKQLMISRELIPSLAILDFNLPMTMPTTVAAHSGMDALAHALEAIVCKASSPLVLLSAETAALEVFHYLALSVQTEPTKPEFAQARERMHSAASLAGMAINNSGAGLAHALDQIGPLLGLPHGLVCALLLPYTVDLCCPHPTYAQLAQKLGYQGDEPTLCKCLVQRLWTLARDLGIPAALKEIRPGSWGILEAEMNHLINEAQNSMGAKLAPVQPDAGQILGVFSKVYEGIEP